MKYSAPFLSKKHSKSKYAPALLRIQECPLQVECLVENIIKRDSHAIVELRVNHVHADVSLLKDNDIIDADLWSPLIYNFRSYHGITESIGRNFKFDN